MSNGVELPIDSAPFVEHYYANALPDELAGDAAIRAAIALGHLRFAVTRKRGKPKVRVFNPTLERDGWVSDRTIVEMVNDDMPFLVDSSSMTLASLGHAIHVTIHPRFVVERSGDGRITDVKYLREDDAKIESFIHIEITREADAQVLRGIEQALEATLRDVRVAVTDWEPMLAKIREAASGLSATKLGSRSLVTESCDFLHWLADGNFTLLGYGDYELVRGSSADTLRMKPGTGLGLLRDETRGGGGVELRGRARKEARSRTPLVITKADTRSTVHRPALLDHIGVKVFDEDVKPKLERRFVGLFTSVAYNENPREIPLLRHKVAALMERSELDPVSHRGKTFQHILDTFPRDDLFQGSIDELQRMSAGILALQGRHKVKLFCRREIFGRFYSCLVYLPRDHYSLRTRRAIEQRLLVGFGAKSVESEVTISESSLARLVVIVRVDPAQTREPDVAKIERELEETVRTWTDRFRAALLGRLPEDRALALFRRFADRFPAGYQEDVVPARAAEDVDVLERLVSGKGALEITLGHSSLRPERLRFTTFSSGDPIPLHVALPILENLGFKVMSERVYAVHAPERTVWIQDFELEGGGEGLASPADSGRLKECFEQVLGGAADNDAFNSFVVTEALDWRQAALLRAYCKYILQIGLPFSLIYMRNVLGRYRGFCRALIEQLDGRFNPDLAADARKRKEVDSERVIVDELDRTTSLDDDRILRAFASVVGATVRTSFYKRHRGSPVSYLALKLDARRIPELPRPRPMFEIYVHSRRVEGVHLRSSKIARGGIRWSDRADFRTEILGLMKAQQVKNAVIVPSGAKGGFVCKQLPQGDREAVQREVVTCYGIFIRGLLDITDNLVDGRPATPDRVIALDDADPYLVVAADKGTATFSDIANGLSAEYGFWLGDAFASGGSAGYDHKKMGITARGAWEGVKRHFRELGLDTQREPFTVIGIGDMAGDVFGNAMLMSRHLKLIAAFNHQHIFIDPDPAPAASFKERQRLFRLARSTWEDYDRAKLSRGGGIYSRQTKSINLDAAAQAALGVSESSMTPPELIRAILRAPADLLWNGGIGTYVKASSQSHGDAGDPANDGFRVNGNDLRCRVVGEGGNLGFTQLGRVEYALAGGYINTDFIDNSGGVDTSDREVNLKILFSDAIAAGKLTRPARNALLKEMTEDVTRLVLGNNYGQTQALSMLSWHAAERLGEHSRLMRVLETHGWLDRTLEFLPTEDQIEERRAVGRGLTRPELAIILSYSKIELRASLLESDVPEDPFLARELEAYFPAQIKSDFKPLIHKHRLAREIVAMLIASSMVNRMGPFFVLRTQEETGASVIRIARAYAIAREVFEVRPLWREIEALDYAVESTVQYDSMVQISRMVRRAVYWFLQNYSDALDIEPMVTRFRPGVQSLYDSVESLISGRVAQRLKTETAELTKVGLPPEVAKRIALLALTTQALDIIELAREFKLTLDEIAGLYLKLAQTLRLDWIREQIEALKTGDRWRGMARATLRETLAQQLRGLVRSVLHRRAGKTPAEALAMWLAKSQDDVTRVQRAIDDMQTAENIDFAALTVALKEVARLT